MLITVDIKQGKKFNTIFHYLFQIFSYIKKANNKCTGLCNMDYFINLNYKIIFYHFIVEFFTDVYVHKYSPLI